MNSITTTHAITEKNARLIANGVGCDFTGVTGGSDDTGAVSLTVSGRMDVALITITQWDKAVPISDQIKDFIKLIHESVNEE